jgi:hypothetical protein
MLSHVTLLQWLILGTGRALCAWLPPAMLEVDAAFFLSLGSPGSHLGQ